MSAFRRFNLFQTMEAKAHGCVDNAQALGFGRTTAVKQIDNPVSTFLGAPFRQGHLCWLVKQAMLMLVGPVGSS